MLGLSIYIVGNVLSFVAFAFASQSLVAPLGASGLASNVVFAPLINKEVVLITDYIGIVFIVLGSLVVLIVSPSNEKPYTVDELMQMYTEIPTILLLLTLAIASLAAYGLTWRKRTSQALSIDEDLILLDPGKRKNQSVLIPISYTFLSAVSAALTTLLSKSLVELLNETFRGNNQFNTLLPYIFIVLVGVFALAQLYFINKGLQAFDALLVMPLFHAVWTLLTVLCGGVYFSDFSGLGLGKILVFLIGVLLGLIGAVVLSLRHNKQKE